jgi:hypothetical protein
MLQKSMCRSLIVDAGSESQLNRLFCGIENVRDAAAV